MVGDRLLETEPGYAVAVVAEVEATEPGQRLLRARGNGIEVILHGGGEAVVHELGEVLLEQLDHGKGREARHQCRALLPDIATILDGRDD